MDLVMLALTVIFPASEAEVMKDPKILNQVLLGCFAEGWVPEIVDLKNSHGKILPVTQYSVPCSLWGMCCWDQQT